MNTSADEQRADPLLGTMVGGYRIEGVLGAGAMGVVYCARHPTLGLELAIKVMHETVAYDHVLRQRFLLEARAGTMVDDPHVIRVVDVATLPDGRFYISMDRLKGESLDSLLERSGPLSPGEAVAIIAQVLDGLAAIHSKGIVHRDLKPSNLFVTRRDDGSTLIKVLDFGIARLGLSKQLTHTGVILGTPSFMAPEQLSAESAVDHRADLYAVGHILYWMIAGVPAFDSPDAVELMWMQRHTPAPPLPISRWTNKALTRAVERALAKDPADRYSSSVELKAALIAAIGGEHALAVIRQPEFHEMHVLDQPEGNSTKAATVQSQSTLAPIGPGSRVRKRKFSARSLLITLGGAAVVLIAAGSWAMQGDPRSETGATPTIKSVSASIPPPAYPPRIASARSVLRVGTNIGLHNLMATMIGHAIHRDVMCPDSTGALVPELIDEIPSLSNGLARVQSDGSFEVSWVFRDGIRWSDGQPFDLEDARLGMATWRTQHLRNIRLEPPRTVVAVWDELTLEALGPWQALPSHVIRTIVPPLNSDQLIDYLRRTIMPSVGPYRVIEWVPGERIIVDRNPHYFGAPAAIARIEIYRRPREELPAAFRAGEFDVLLRNSVTLEQALELEQTNPGAVDIRPSAWVMTLQPPIETPPFDQLEVRQALLMALDRERIGRERYARYARVAHTAYWDEAPAAVRRYPYDPEAAREVLSQHGLTAIRVGYRIGEQVTASAIASDLRHVGLEVELVVIENVDAIEREQSFDGLLLTIAEVSRLPEDLTPVDFDEWNLPRVNGSPDVTHRHDAFDDVVAALLDRLGRTMDERRRNDLFDAALTAYSERLPTLPITHVVERVIVDPALRGWDIGFERSFGSGIESWHFRPE